MKVKFVSLFSWNKA